MDSFKSKIICGTAFILIGVYSSPYAANQWVFGANKAKHFQGSNSKHYYVSLGAFHNKHNAQRFYKKMKAKQIEGVHMSSKRRGTYDVFVGPISAAEVRQVGAMASGKVNGVKARSLPVYKTSSSSISMQPAHSAKPASVLASVISPHGKSSPVVTLSLGASWTHGNTTNLILTPTVTNTYTVTNGTNAFILGELFTGTQKELASGWMGQLGTVVTLSGKAPIAGEIWVNTDPTLNNYDYNYSVNHSYFGFQGKVLKDTNWYTIQPYLSGSIGLAMNYAHGYYSAPITIPQTVTSASFASRVTPSFSYTLGAGLDKAINSSWSTGVGYEFSDWGRGSLGVAPGQFTNKGLTLNHMYNNAVLVNLSYHG